MHGIAIKLFAVLLWLSAAANAATVVFPSQGGTGIPNANTKTITLGGPLVTLGANSVTFTSAGATNVTLPTSGTLATTAQLIGGSWASPGAAIGTGTPVAVTGTTVTATTVFAISKAGGGDLATYTNGTTTFSIGINNSAQGGYLFNGGAHPIRFGTSGTEFWRMAADGAFNLGTALDTSLYRVSSGVIGVGTGAAGSTAGSLSMAGIAASGAAVVLSGLGATTGTPSSLCLNGTTVTVNAALTCTVSSARHKDNIQPFTVSALSLVRQIEPSTFFYKDRYDRNRIGFTAESLAKVDRRLAEWDANGSPSSIDFPAIAAVLVKSIQEQQVQIDEIRRAQ